MALRNKLPDEIARYPDPVLGINLRMSLEDLEPGYAALLQNCVWDGGVKNRYGSETVIQTSQGAYRGLGGHRFYYQTTSKARLAVWNKHLFSVSDTGGLTTLTNGLTADKDGHFETWSITDAAYYCNEADGLVKVDNTLTLTTVTGTNIPSTPKMAKPFLDRLFAIQDAVVVASNPRVDTVFATTGSSWSAYRPVGSGGRPTALHLHSLTGQQGDPLAELLIFQAGSVTALTGSDFGDDVTQANPPNGWDARLRLLDPSIGTESPYSITTVPGLGTFWFTQHNNVAWLPFNEATPRLIGDRLVSLNRTDVNGIQLVNTTSRKQVVMFYHDRYLKLCIPVNATYANVQYWLDVRSLQNDLNGQQSPQRGFVWYGPMLGQNIGRAWVEDRNGDPEDLMVLEGDQTLGVYLYRLNVPNLYADAYASTTVAITPRYTTFYHGFGMPSYEKMMPLVRVDGQGNINNWTLSVDDLHGADQVSGMSITRVNGAAFSYITYGSGTHYGSGNNYGASAAPQVGHAFLSNQGETIPTGDRLAIDIVGTAGRFQVNAIYPQVQVRKRQPVS